jgi:hypothetical protein
MFAEIVINNLGEVTVDGRFLEMPRGLGEEIVSQVIRHFGLLQQRSGAEVRSIWR